MKTPIGFIAYAFHRNSGGIVRYSKELLHALQQAHINVAILQAGKDHSVGATFPLKGANLLPGLLTIGQIQIAKITRQQKLPLVHDPTGCAPLWLTETKRVVTIHDVIPYIYPETSSRLDWMIYRLWLPMMMNRLDSVITVSQHSKSDLIRCLAVKPEKITVIPEAASEMYQPLDQNEIENKLLRYGIHFPYILYVGSIEARKNLKRLVEAYAQVRSWSGTWKLVIVGAQKWKYSSVFSTLEQLELNSDVHFTGYVAEEDLPALYNGASLFVFPSIYEGFGLPVLEALACGTPVITSNRSSLPEVAGEAAVLVDPLDANAIALAIRSVLEDPDLAFSMRQKGMVQSRKFSWKQTASQTAAVYENLLQ